WKALPRVTQLDEIEELVAQGFLIAEEIQATTPIGESYRRALAARLANRLRDFWRQQHPERRRNTRARRQAAARGEEYVDKVYVATGLAHEHELGNAWDGEALAPRGDVVADVYDRMKMEELAGITS